MHTRVGELHIVGELLSGACSRRWRGGRVVQEAAQRVGKRRIGLQQQWADVVQRQQQVAEQSVAQQYCCASTVVRWNCLCRHAAAATCVAMLVVVAAERQRGCEAGSSA